MALTPAQKQQAYRNRKHPPTAKDLLVSRFKALTESIHHERLDLMLTKWEQEAATKQGRK